jgi:acetylornithine/succinyldiaminopimelate/putrescine aminotransferase
MRSFTNRQLFQKFLAPTSDSPSALEIVKAKGIYLYDKEGKSYIDLISGIAVSNVGHRNKKIISAIKKQLDLYMHLMVYGEYIQSPQVLLAQALVNSTKDPSLNQVYFTNSGTEAVEGAMKLAKRYTGRTNFISCINAYHGSTQGALSLAGDENFKNSFRPLLPNITHINYGREEDLVHINNKTAAIIIEIIGGESGVRKASISYFKALRKRCDETGTLLIIDEIQTGFGRTGTFWAYEAMEIIPDVLLTAKGMGGGMPIGAFIANENLMKSLSFDPILGHITTFGGHPVNCAASLATLNYIIDENLMEDVPSKSQLFKDLLVHPMIKEVRAVGLMIAVEFENFEIIQKIISNCLYRGLITDWFLFCNNSLRIAPPLIITMKEIKIACKIILQAINEVEMEIKS